MKHLLKSKKKPDKKNTQTTMQDENMDTQLDKKPTLWDVIAPDGLTINAEDYGVIKQSLGTKTYFRPFYIPQDGYPRKMKTNWLYSLISSGEIDVLIDVHKIPKPEAMRQLQRQLTMLESNLSFQRRRGNIDQIQDLETKIQDTEILMGEIQFSENDIFHVGTLGILYADSEKELDRYSELVEDEMSSMFFKLATTWSRVKKGFRSALPIGRNEIYDSLRNIDRRALSTFSPFISGSGKYMGGVPIGINKITGQLEFFNTFGNNEYRPKNYNSFIVGTSGSGKSVTLKLLIAREMTGADVYARVIDPEGEFVKITKRLGGININISEESDIRLNPCAISETEIPIDEEDEELELLDVNDEKEVITRDGRKYLRFVPIREKQNEILDFFDIIVRGKDGEQQGLSVFERNYLEEAIKAVFNELGITTHPYSLYTDDVLEIDGQIIQSRVRKPEPTISDIYNYLTANYGKEKKAARLIAAIRPFLRDGSKPIFDGQTYLGRGVTQSLHKARLVNFNITDLEEGFLRPIAYHVILNFLWEYFVKNSENATLKKVVYADEAWTLIDNEQTVSFLEKMARRARKRNAGLRLASQDFVRFVKNEKARGILQNTHTYLFFEQQKMDLKAIKENFTLSEGELDILFGNPDKGEGILRIGDSSVWIQTNPSEEEFLFIESNQAVYEEMMRRKKMQKR
jgi:hypothetical protein